MQRVAMPTLFGMFSYVGNGRGGRNYNETSPIMDTGPILLFCAAKFSCSSVYRLT
jgi:hypothetical protein